MTGRACAWCRGPIPARLRSDAVCCSVRCRQARHRFVSGVGVAPDVTHDASLRIAYADPPYPGKSRRYYGTHRDFAGEVDHSRLVEQLAGYDGWALSTSAHALREILALCPAGSRVGAWVRGERPTRSAGPLNAWEPVIYWGGRRDASRHPGARVAVTGENDASRLTVAAHDASWSPGERVAEDLHDASRDSGAPIRVASTRTTGSAYASELLAATDQASSEYSRRVDVLTYRPGARTTEPGRVTGAKPAAFCRWMFDLLGAAPQDDFTDLFPGSGGVGRAWDIFAGRNDLATTRGEQ